MKKIFLLLFAAYRLSASCQTLQLYYDPRHTIKPDLNGKNFVTTYFEYYKELDSGRALIKPGSFLLKMQADFMGDQANTGKFYMQVSQSFRCWTPKVFLNLQYSGGLGVTNPRQYSYYITNTYSIGASYPFKCKSAFLSAVLNLKYVSYTKPSYDFLCTLYWWQPVLQYRAEFSGDFSLWTENRNHGDDMTRNLKGKRFYFFAEPQCWYKLSGPIAAGTKVNLFYHINTTENIFEVYPSVGLRCKF